MGPTDVQISALRSHTGTLFTTMAGTSWANRCPEWRPPVPHRHRDLIPNDGPPPHSGGQNTTLCSSAPWCCFTQCPYLQVSAPPVEWTTTYYTAYSRSRGIQLLQYGHRSRNSHQPHLLGSHHPRRSFAPHPDSNSTYLASDTNSVCVLCCTAITPEVLHTRFSKEEESGAAINTGSTECS